MFSASNIILLFVILLAVVMVKKYRERSKVIIYKYLNSGVLSAILKRETSSLFVVLRMKYLVRKMKAEYASIKTPHRNITAWHDCYIETEFYSKKRW